MEFETRPGDRATKVDETCVLRHGGVPDWVTVPAELGGGRAKVTGAETLPCPRHPEKHSVLTLRLDKEYNEATLCVAECEEYLWHTRKSAAAPGALEDA